MGRKKKAIDAKLDDIVHLTEQQTQELLEALPPAHEAPPGPPQEELVPLKPGDEGYVDPAKFEQELVAEEQARLNAPHDEEEIACMMLKLYTPRFNAAVDKLSTRALRRMVKALQAFPLGDNYSPKDKSLEAEAFAIGKSLKDAQMVLIVKTYHENADKIEALAAEARANTTLTFGENEEKKEETNGEVKA